jgi:hypothetical protein
MRESQSPRKRGAFKGPIRIPSSSLGFFFNDLEFSRIPAKFLKLQLALFSIPTATTGFSHSSPESLRILKAAIRAGAASAFLPSNYGVE